MPIVTPANNALFFATLEVTFWKALTAAENWWTQIAETRPCGSEIWAESWVGMIDTYREWVGPRQVREMAPQTYVVPVQNFELTVGLDQFKIMDDQHGVYIPKVMFMGMQAKKLPDYQLRDLILNLGRQTGAARQSGTDGLTHFNTAHPIDFYDASKGTYCNDYTGGVSIGGTTVGGPFSVNAFNTIWEDMAARKSENGEALGIAPDLTMGPPQLQAAMKTVLQASFIGMPQVGGLGAGSGANGTMVGATENMMKGWTDLFINKDFSAAPTTWFEMITKGPIKPFGWVDRMQPNYIDRSNPNDPEVFDNHRNLCGSLARGAPCWSPPFLSARSG